MFHLHVTDISVSCTCFKYQCFIYMSHISMFHVHVSDINISCICFRYQCFMYMFQISVSHLQSQALLLYMSLSELSSKTTSEIFTQKNKFLIYSDTVRFMSVPKWPLNDLACLRMLNILFCFKLANVPFSDECIDILIKKLDVNGDGEIDFR